METDPVAKSLDFIRNVNEFRKGLNQAHKPSWMKLTTITMVSSQLKDQGKSLDPDRVRQVFRHIKYYKLRLKGRKTYNKWRVFYSDFYNQVTIGYEDNQSTKKVKIFPNGAIQVAGCSDLVDCHQFIRQLAIIIKRIFGIDIDPLKFKIVMINSNFSLNHKIDLYRVVDLFTGKAKVSFDPDRYSAVKIKFKPGEGMKEVTNSIFTSGAVIITGANTIDEIAASYKMIVGTIIACPEAYVQPNNNDKTFSHFLGHRIDEWVV
jgi:TATA-box binding protein (TBP) (component of TFIID and TFIIIB)